MCRLLYIQLEVEAWVCINPHIKCVRFMTVLIIHSEPDPVCWSCSDGDTADWKEPGEERARGSDHCHAPVHCEGLLRLCLYLVSPSLYVCVYISDIQLIAKRRLVGVQCLSQSHVVIACGLLRGSNLWIFFHGIGATLPPFLYLLSGSRSDLIVLALSDEGKRPDRIFDDRTDTINSS